MISLPTHTKTVLCLLSLTVLLSACVDRKDPIDSIQGMKSAREKRLSTAAYEAIAAGRTDEALELYTKRYEHDGKDKVAALNYAQLLRKNGNPQKAADILAPLAKNSPHDGVLLNEYAAALIELGQLETAEKILTGVIGDPEMASAHADAQNLMGVMLASQGRHAEAEKLFREAWEGWKGDATSVMNNLGLAQANQGKFNEALTTLRRALAMAPQKTEIARNIQIVTSLRDAAPASPNRIKKPEAKKPAAKKTVTKTTVTRETIQKPAPVKTETPVDDDSK